MNNKLNNKAPLSWDKEDYLLLGIEPPECVLVGITEGEEMREDEIEIWAADQVRILSVISDEHPDKYNHEYQCFLNDLDYLQSIGKISKAENEEYRKKENF